MDDFLLVGSGSNKKVYVFKRTDSGAYRNTTELIASDASPDSIFGISLDGGGGDVLVHDCRDDASYLFSFQYGVWKERAKFDGCNTALSGNSIVTQSIGAVVTGLTVGRVVTGLPVGLVVYRLYVGAVVMGLPGWLAVDGLCVGAVVTGLPVGGVVTGLPVGLIVDGLCFGALVTGLPGWLAVDEFRCSGRGAAGRWSE